MMATQLGSFTQHFNKKILSPISPEDLGTIFAPDGGNFFESSQVFSQFERWSAIS